MVAADGWVRVMAGGLSSKGADGQEHGVLPGRSPGDDVRASGELVQLSPPVNGLHDLLAEHDRHYRYHVVSYSARGVESAPSETVSILNPRIDFDRIFADGFEPLPW